MDLFKKNAALILGYFDLRFINRHKNKQEAMQERRLWADELKEKTKIEQLSEDNIKKALDLWCDINDKGYAPTIDQFVTCIQKVDFENRPTLEQSQRINAMAHWLNADDKAKYRFFIDYPYQQVAPVVRWLFHEYNISHRGWTMAESIKMMNYHALPFAGAGHGAMTNHQNDILQYFINRKAA